MIAPDPLLVRPLQAADRPAIEGLLGQGGLFTLDEIAVALELIDGALRSPAGDYRVRVALSAGRMVGYICYGPTPMTDATWDLYWIVADAAARGRGVGSTLVEAMERELRLLSARQVRVETSTLDGYGAAHRFYARNGYPEVSRLADFYKPGDDLITLCKRL